MILGIGIDIIDNRRIKKTILKYGKKFKERCFSKNEIKISKNSINQINFFSKRYAAKEALSKALGTGLNKGVFWKDIEVINNLDGKPYIKLYNKALKKLNNLSKNNIKIEVSLSDEKNYSIANVVIFTYEK
tara:strand:+ start:241 stop:633 length:393 start_codon:yes stop_codon:yes gene_type:complete